MKLNVKLDKKSNSDEIHSLVNKRSDTDLLTATTNDKDTTPILKHVDSEMLRNIVSEDIIMEVNEEQETAEGSGISNNSETMNVGSSTALSRHRNIESFTENHITAHEKYVNHY